MINAVWDGATLVTDGTVIAAVTADNELTVDGTRIDVSHTAGALRWQVTGTSAHEEYKIRMRGLATGNLVAHCGPRSYRARRDSAFSTSRTIVDEEGVVVGRTRPRSGTELHTEIYDAAPLADLVFITWALTFMDTPGRTTKI